MYEDKKYALERWVRDHRDSTLCWDEWASLEDIMTWVREDIGVRYGGEILLELLQQCKELHTLDNIESAPISRRAVRRGKGAPYPSAFEISQRAAVAANELEETERLVKGLLDVVRAQREGAEREVRRYRGFAGLKE